jgi:hypothetical protein
MDSINAPAIRIADAGGHRRHHQERAQPQGEHGASTASCA